MIFWFTKGVNRKYPNRWYLSAHPEAQVVQYFPRTDVRAVSHYIKSLGFKPGLLYQCLTYYDTRAGKWKKNYDNRNLYIVFKNKADEAYFVMLIGNGIEL
jgi:hypothetical protein